MRGIRAVDHQPVLGRIDIPPALVVALEMQAAGRDDAEQRLQRRKRHRRLRWSGSAPDSGAAAHWPRIAKACHNHRSPPAGPGPCCAPAGSRMAGSPSPDRGRCTRHRCGGHGHAGSTGSDKGTAQEVAPAPRACATTSRTPDWSRKLSGALIRRPEIRLSMIAHVLLFVASAAARPDIAPQTTACRTACGPHNASRNSNTRWLTMR